ncbi:hypothetical protein GGR57DRAFT_25411 [Xylariaceae sp. FL1272]|nr:hypothetical protein GGR57DRAFT_25411 [Xylariaceae sp. FL1272]
MLVDTSRVPVRCNGTHPCNTCVKRQLECHYTPAGLDHSGSSEGIGSPTKRRHVDSSPNMIKLEDTGQSAGRRGSTLTSWNQVSGPGDMALERAAVAEPIQQKQVEMAGQLLGTTERDFDSRSRLSNASAAVDEADAFPPERMLQDSTGRLLYIGDSASLTYLQWIRMIVESISGPSDFTKDPRRHMIMENRISLPSELRPTGVLPDQRTAAILISSFFTNTAGLVELFDQANFLKVVEETYRDPLTANPSLLCLMFLVFAVGLVMAAPFPGSDEAAIIDRLRSESTSRAEVFFRNAKSLADPVSGFEDADFWSVQALLLMSLYMLAVSKRNASYAYYGMAVRSAFALGLHRDESMIIFTQEERDMRKKLWKSLFVLDRFLAACLGRPTAISEEDCSEIRLPRHTSSSLLGTSSYSIHLAALDAAVKSCRIIGRTLKSIYSKRKIATAVAQDIANHLEAWNKELPFSLHWRRLQNNQIDPAQGIAILHTNLLHCHSVMLLTRPFFLYLLNKARMGTDSGSIKKSSVNPRIENFAQTCLEASQHTLVLTRIALDGKYLPQCNPFVIHCVFAAALIVLSNEFAALYHNPDARSSIGSAASILRFCAHTDAQADRVSYIVESFDKANEGRGPNAKRLYFPGRKTPTLHTLSQNSNLDPMRQFFNLGRSDPLLMSSFSDDQTLTSLSLPPISSIPSLMSTSAQQPSPEGSASMSSGIGTATSLGQAMGESEFDLNNIWSEWQTTPAPSTSVHPSTSYAAYSVGQLMNGPSVMYHTSDFR